jgi:hypothetical protein
MKHDDLRAELVESIAMHNELRVVPLPSLQVIYSNGRWHDTTPCCAAAL